MIIKKITADEIRDRFDGARVIGFESEVDIHFSNGLRVLGVKQISLQSEHLEDDIEPCIIVRFESYENDLNVFKEIARIETDEVMGLRESFCFPGTYSIFTKEDFKKYRHNINTLPFLTESTLHLDPSNEATAS